MRYPLLIFALGLAFTACRPTLQQYLDESGQAFEGYIVGDIQTAKAALLAEEKVISKYEAAGTKGYDFHYAYLHVYARLCAIHHHLGEEDQAAEYYKRALIQRQLLSRPLDTDVTMEQLLDSIEKFDKQLPPKWRQEK